MAKLSRDDVLKLALLSKLELSEKEIEKFRNDIGAILDYVEQLKKIDTKSLEPTSQVTGLKNVTRRDEIVDYGVNQKDLLKNVPTTDKNQIKVKRVL